MALPHFYLAFFMFLSLLLIACAIDYEYRPNPNYDPKPHEDEWLLSTMVGIQGRVYCQSGLRRFPLEGAVTRITCLAVDEYGSETAPFSILSGATDARGYFFATLSPNEVRDNWRLKKCKAFLEKSPLETCKIPTDMNGGINGALLASYHFLYDKKMKLFTVGPFFYTS